MITEVKFKKEKVTLLKNINVGQIFIYSELSDKNLRMKSFNGIDEVVCILTGNSAGEIRNMDPHAKVILKNLKAEEV